jgi:hypothetical protein
MTAFDVLPVLGGTVSIAASYSILLRCVQMTVAIPSRGIVVLVKCAICGYVANVNPRILAIYGHRPHRSMLNPPEVWICDMHLDDEATKASES